MAIYLVRAKIKNGLGKLREELESGKISMLKPFGETLQYALENARVINDRYALWVEEDYCSPPLAMERESLLDRYFEDTTVQRVISEEDGWRRIGNTPQLWTWISPVFKCTS